MKPRSGAVTVFGWMSGNGTFARAFYHKWGFMEVGTQVFQLGDDLQNDLLMQRPVNIALRATAK
jgi:hypothetical protein